MALLFLERIHVLRLFQTHFDYRQVAKLDPPQTNPETMAICTPDKSLHSNSRLSETADQDSAQPQTHPQESRPLTLPLPKQHSHRPRSQHPRQSEYHWYFFQSVASINAGTLRCRKKCTISLKLERNICTDSDTVTGLHTQSLSIINIEPARRIVRPVQK